MANSNSAVRDAAAKKPFPSAPCVYYSDYVRVASGWCGGSTRTLVGCVLISLALVTPAQGATLLRTLDDPLNLNGGGFGAALGGVGLQLAVGAPGTPGLGPDGAGVVQLYGS